MSMLDLNLNDVPDRKLLEDGEYSVRCIKSEVKDSKATEGNRYIELLLEVPADPAADLITHRIMIANDTDTERAGINKKRNLKDACLAFGLDLTRPNTDDFVGRTAWATIRTSPENGSFAAKNEINRFVIGA